MRNYFKETDQVVRRELRRIVRQPMYWVLMVVLPVVSFAFFAVIFERGVARNIPIAVLDEDHTTLSRKVTQMIDDTPTAMVSYEVQSMEEAQRLMREGRISAIVHIPAFFEKNILSNSQTHIECSVSGTNITVNGLLSKDLQTAVTTFQAGVQLQLLMKQGLTEKQTGGKTVSLKTVGLFTLMGQSGLHIPARDRSELAVFKQVYADIGDEQSIEQSLSTFSSHMTNIVSFLHDVDENSLVLFDELGAGTDPTEGAALAIAILSYLHGRGIRTMATTHYSELKVYALSTPGVENACCEFDVESLRPTYRLLIGIPGKSNAFAISGKLGLPDYIIEDAKTRLSEQDVSFEDLISDLETSKRTIEKEQEEIAAYKKEIEALKSQAQQKQERIEEQRERILAEAREKANTILRDAKDVADETIKNFRKFGKENISAAEMEKERERLRKKMKENTASSSLKVQKPKKEYKPTDFKLGESVKVLSMNLTGTISSLPDSRGNVTVQMGILRSQVHISDLEIIEEANPYAPKSFKRTSKGKLKMSKSLSVSPEINLLGKTVDEAVSELDKYLDDALLSHLSTVRVVHGKGTGALRKGIHEFLRRQKHVKSYRLGEFGEGDAGVTIVELK